MAITKDSYTVMRTIVPVLCVHVHNTGLMSKTEYLVRYYIRRPSENSLGLPLPTFISLHFLNIHSAAKGCLERWVDPKCALVHSNSELEVVHICHYIAIQAHLDVEPVLNPPTLAHLVRLAVNRLPIERSTHGSRLECDRYFVKLSDREPSLLGGVKTEAHESTLSTGRATNPKDGILF